MTYLDILVFFSILAVAGALQCQTCHAFYAPEDGTGSMLWKSKCETLTCAPNQDRCMFMPVKYSFQAQAAKGWIKQCGDSRTCSLNPELSMCLGKRDILQINYGIRGSPLTGCTLQCSASNAFVDSSSSRLAAPFACILAAVLIYLLACLI